MVTALLAAGAHPHAVDRDGLTPLHLAVINDEHALIVQLVQAGAPVCDETPCRGDGGSALALAIQQVRH